jgi:hypothetical protein
MVSRSKWLLCALTCLAAVLTAATLAQAVEQFPKNGCASPQAYTGSLTSPPVNVPDPIEGPGPVFRFDGWFEVESVNPGSFDSMVVEYSLDPGPGQPRDNWVQFGQLIDQAVPPSGGGADQPYSNNGTNVAPTFRSSPFSFDVPAAAFGATNVQFRIRFDTGDGSYQGFRGLGVDNVLISNVPSDITQNFDNGTPPGWNFEGASGPGGPFWQLLTNPQNVSVKSPEINPELVTLPDSGALPAAASSSGIAWFGNTDSGTFCGPDFALRPDLAAPDTTITSGPPSSTASNGADFSFTSSEAGSFFECQLDGGGFTSCPSPRSYSGLADSAHTFEVRATDPAGNTDPTPASYAWTIRPATLADLDNPTLGVDVNVQEISGTVRVGIRTAAARAAGSGRASQKGITFVPLSEARQIPVGSFLDTRKGKVRLESAANRAGKRQRGTFFNSLFQVRQSKKVSARGLTDLVMKGSSFRRCRAGSSKSASAALTRRQIRQLRANARGRFRTSGRNSSATVRGTNWGVIDRCDGTLTRVRRGRVVVRDFRLKRNVILTAGKSYLAKAPR